MLDLFCIILYIAGFAVHYFDPAMLTHTRRLYSIALFIMFLRLLNVLLLIKRIGIIIIMIKEMVSLNIIKKKPRSLIYAKINSVCT